MRFESDKSQETRAAHIAAWAAGVHQHYAERLLLNAIFEDDVSASEWEALDRAKRVSAVVQESAMARLARLDTQGGKAFFGMRLWMLGG